MKSASLVFHSQTGFLVGTMQSVYLLCGLVLLTLACENVRSQDYSSSRRPGVLVSSSSGVRRAYVPPPSTGNENVHSEINNEDSKQDAEKVRLDVYYATDCPDSMRFIIRQLFPLYQEMGDVLDIHLVPYGKARETYDEEKKKYNFRCQHGPSECYGNTIQSCAMSFYPEKEYMNFIYCMENYARPSVNAAKCARRQSLDWDKIRKCANSDEGERLLHEMAEKTKNLDPRLYFVPWIVVNGVYSESNQRTALRNLKGLVCDTYKGNHSSCQEEITEL